MHALIIENDLTAYRQLVKILKQLEPGVDVAGHAASVKEAFHWLRHHKSPDLIFSVINLPDGLSFEIFNKLDKKIPVIFTCIQEKYALDAFKSMGISYLLKPFNKDDLAGAIEKYNQFYTKTGKSKAGGKARYQKRLLVNIGKQMKVVQAEEIAYFYTDKKIVYLVTFDGSKYVMNSTLEKLETLLNPELFFRINRQFIISLPSISRMMPASKSRQQVFLRPKSAHTTVTSFNRTNQFYKWLLGSE